MYLVDRKYLVDRTQYNKLVRKHERTEKSLFGGNSSQASTCLPSQKIQFRSSSCEIQKRLPVHWLFVVSSTGPVGFPMFITPYNVSIIVSWIYIPSGTKLPDLTSRVYCVVGGLSVMFAFFLFARS